MPLFKFRGSQNVAGSVPAATQSGVSNRLKAFGLGDPIATSDDANVDVIFIHGLNGDRETTFTENGCFWIKELLPDTLRSAKLRPRIFSYGYNADTHSKTPVSTQDLWTHGETFLSRVVMKRKRDDTTRRPIVFVAHSLGGLILKGALARSSTYNIHHKADLRALFLSTHGILFCGVPHQGGSGVSLGQICLNIVGIVAHSSRKLVDALDPASTELRTNLESYVPISNQFYTVFIYETLPTPIQIKGTSLTQVVVVKRESAVVQGQMNAAELGLNKNHETLVKFSSVGDSEYNDFCDYLIDVMKKPYTAVNDRWAEWDRSCKFQSNASNMLRFGYPFARNARFAGREKEILELKLNFENKQQALTIAIYGVGGVGKTQLCLEYVYRYQNSYSSIFWIDASTKSAIELCYLKIIQELVWVQAKHAPSGTPDYDHIAREFRIVGLLDSKGRLLAKSEDEIQRVISSFKEWLSKDVNQQWLLILDGHDNLDFPLLDYLPTCAWGAYIITSRSPRIRSYASYYYELEGLDEASALELLFSICRRDQDDVNVRQDALRVIHKLEFHPLAIDQAAAFLGQQQHISLRGWIDQYESKEVDLRARELLENNGHPWPTYKLTCMTTFEMSRQAIVIESREANVLFQVCSYFNKDDIWVGFLKRAYRVLDHVESEDTIDKLVAILHSYSLIRPQVGENTFSIHGVIHTWGRERLNLDERTVGTLAAIGMMTAVSLASGIEREDRLVEEWPIEQRLVPHLEFVLDVSNEFFGLWSLKAGMMANMCTDQDFREEILGMVDDVLSHLTKNPPIMPSVPDSKTPSPLTALTNEESVRSSSGSARDLAWKSLLIAGELFKRQGKFKSYIRTELRRLYLNMSNPSVKDQIHILCTLAGLSGALRNIGELHAAVIIAEWAYIAILERAPEEADILLKLQTSIVLCKSELGSLARVPPTLTRDTLASISNPASPQEATLISDLAVAMALTSNFRTAVELHRQALAIRQKKLPNGHVDILTSKNGLGCALQALEEEQTRQEGLVLIREAFEGRKAIYGEHHPETARSHQNLAIACTNMQQHVEALEHYRLGLEYWKENGEGSIAEMVYCRTSYSSCLLKMRRFLKAREIAKLSALEQARYSGWEHPWTLIAVNVWADSLVKIRRLHAARNLYRFVLEIRRKIPREDKASKDAVDGIWYIYHIYQEIGEHDTAQEIRRTFFPLISILPSVFADANLTDLCDFAIALTREEQYEPAIRLHRLVLDRRLTTLPGNHKSILTSMNSLAVTLEKKGGSDNLLEALELQTKALQGRKQILCADDPAIARSLSNMGVIQEKLGRLTKASECYRESLQAWAAVPTDPECEAIITRMNFAIHLANQKLWVKASVQMRTCTLAFACRLGFEHRLTLQAINSWATVSWNLRRLRAARNLYRFVLEMRVRIPISDSILNGAFMGFLRVQERYEELGLSDQAAEMQATGERLHGEIRRRLS